MLSPESALVMASRRPFTTWNVEQIRLYAELEGVDLVRLSGERRVETRTEPTVASGPPAARPVSTSPPDGATVTHRARSWTP